jgi:hypothetical protein
MDRPSGRVEPPLNSLAELRLSDQTLDAVLGRIGALALRTLPGWDAVAASMVERDRVATFGTTDDRINPVDQAQYDGGGGPCLDAIAGGEFKYFNGGDIPANWRQFAQSAAAADVYSVASFPMKLDGEVMGALNFYSRERDALRNGQHEEGALFAAQAAATLANAKALIEGGEKVEQLEEALETRTMIGQATGLLMAQEGLTSDEAFQKLVRVSQNANVKLRDIAQKYVAAWETKAQRTQDT